MAVVSARNTKLASINLGIDITSDFKSDIIDFKEMSIIAIQAVIKGADVSDGDFELQVSLLCDVTTFIKVPGSERPVDPLCPAVGWEYRDFAWRFVRVCYTKGTDTVGAFDLFARGKLA